MHSVASLQVVEQLLRRCADSCAESLAPSSPWLHFLQEGVTLKGNSYDEKRNFVGTLFLITDPSKESYVVWAPYGFIDAVAPQLLSPVARRQVVGDNPAPTGDGSGSPTDVPLERLYILCAPTSRLKKMQRRTNLRGKRIVILTRTSGECDHPLIFNDGGMTKFVDELKKLVPLQPSPTQADEYVFTAAEDEAPDAPCDDAQAPAVGATTRGSTAERLALRDEFSSPTTAPKAQPAVLPAPVPPAPSQRSEEAFQKHLYSSSPTVGPDARKPTAQRWMNNVLAFGQKVHDKGARLAEVIVGPSAISSGLSGDMDSFDVVQPIVDVDGLVPVVTKSSDRVMGRPLSEKEWRACFDDEGRLVEEFYARARLKAFQGGIEDSPTEMGTLRGEVWAFFLHVYEPKSTLAERAVLKAERRAEYAVVKQQWSSVSKSQMSRWSSFREHRVAIEKDVQRTDRHHPAFASDDSPKLTQLFDLLMTYSMYNFDLGYCQGMSDIAAIMLLLYKDEIDAFTAFRAMLDCKCQGNFGHDVLKGGMAAQLKAVETLIRGYIPTLSAHLQRVNATDLSFVFRWLLILYKREFALGDVLLLWDVIFASPFTEQYEIFVAAAILRAVSPQILEQSLNYDDLLKFINAIAGRMKGEDVIVLTADFYEFVAQQYGWKKRLAVTEGAAPIRPTLTEVLDVVRASEPSSPGFRQ